MKFRKSVSAFLAAAMLVPSVGIVVSYAAEDEEMKQELTVVKERIEIPEALSDFTHSVATQYGKKYYRFTWSNPDRPQNLYVTVCGKVITRYEYNDYTGDTEKAEPYTFAKLSKEEVRERAQAELERLNPTVAKNLAIYEDGIRISLYGSYAGVPIYRVNDGVKVAGETGQINIDKNTGALLSFRLEWTAGAGFRGADEAITREEAIAGYRSVFPLEKQYVVGYDWETGERTPHLIFQRAEVGQIDAFTGKKATFADSYDYYENLIADAEGFDSDDGDDDVGGDVNPGAGGVTFTDEELEKLELAGSLVTPEQKLADMIASGIWSIPPEAQVGDSNVFTEYRGDLGAYVTNFSICAYETQEYVSIDGAEPAPETTAAAPRRTYYGNALMNAETGEILSFSGTDTKTKSKQLNSEAQAKNRLNGFLKRILGERAEEFILDSPSFSYLGRDRQGNLTEDSYLATASVASPRYIYGIPTDAERVSLKIDHSGRVSSYDLDYLGLEYPEPVGILTEDEAYTRYFEQIDYELLYRLAYNSKQKRVETALVYNASEDFRIDAFSGRITDGEGDAISAAAAAAYTDLALSGCREEAEKLALYGITLMDGNGRLNADMAVTRGDFRRLIRYIGVYYYFDEGESAEKPLTRKFAAKMLAGYARIAEIPGLFRSPYSDVSENDKYVGYIALAAAQGYIKGENGKFRPSAKMTRGDAILLVYDYLNR